VARYRFVDEWLVPAAPEWVYGLLSCPREYPGWWGDAFLAGEGDPGPAAPGKRARLLTRGCLPYRLRWELVCLEARSPTTLVSRIEGDFVGQGTWTITPTEHGTRAVLEWDIEVRRLLVRHLTPLLRPLFAWNHRWAMQRGLERMVELSEAR
jgi:polyketide cyclase/dehydrase/lipid transport protein